MVTCRIKSCLSMILQVKLVLIRTVIVEHYPQLHCFEYQIPTNASRSVEGIDHFRYIKIQLDSEASRTQTKETNKHVPSVCFVCVL